MGYRSQVGVLITTPDNVKPETIIKRFEKAMPDLKDYFNITISEDNSLIQLITKFDLKWYENCEGYEDVTKFMEIVTDWEDEYETGGIHYVRIGEDYQDIDEMCFGEVNEWLGINRSIEEQI